MARKPRLEFAGGIYHVISRGNYRKELFEDGSARAFEKTLFEACPKCGCLLHAYVIMSNHYHLAVETPERNVVEGMRWLQGRCAACHQERQVEGAHSPRIASRAQQRQTHGSLNAWPWATPREYAI
jgi:putative transposase